MSNINYENIWIEKPKYEQAEKLYHEMLSKCYNDAPSSKGPSASIAGEIAKAREHITKSLETVSTNQASKGKSDGVAGSSDLVATINHLKKENNDLRKAVEDLQQNVKDLTIRVKNIEHGVPIDSQQKLTQTQVDSQPKQSQTHVDSQQKHCQTQDKAAAEDDEDVDLFGSESEEEEDEEAKKIREERLSAYAEKKKKKPGVIAKSMVILDVKPWDDETDMKEMEKNVRTIEMDGLLWGASKLVPLAYGIMKLQISTVIHDDLVSVDELQEKIEEFEDFVQSVDIAAFNKI